MESTNNGNENHLLKERSFKDSNGMKRKFSLKKKPSQATHSLLKKCKIEDVIPNCDTLNLSSDFKENPVCFRKTKFVKPCKFVNNSNDFTEVRQFLSDSEIDITKLKIKTEGSSDAEAKMVCSESGQVKKVYISQESCSTDDSNEIFCHICEKKLTHLNEQRQQQHINSCLDSQEEKSRQEGSSEQENNQVIVLDCPMCGKAFNSLKARKVHLKCCAVENETSPVQMMILVHRQEEEARKRMATGVLGKQSSKALMPSHKEQKKVKKRTGNIPEPSNSLDADLHMAVALSMSLIEENSEKLSPFSTDPGPYADAPKKKKIIKSEMVPTLLSRSREENQKLLAERIANIVIPVINGNSSSIPITWSESRHSERSHTSMLPSMMNKDCYLWNLASQDFFKNKTNNLFYVSSLSSLITPCKILPGSKLRRVSEIPGRGSSQAQSSSVHHCVNFKEPNDDSLLLPTQTAGILAELAEEAEAEISPTKYSFHIPKQTPSKLLYAGFFTEDSIISQQAEIIPPRIVKILSDLENLLLSEQFSDLTVYVKNNQSFQVHSSILSCRCPLLLQEIISFSPGESVNWENVSLEAAKSFFKYLYYGNLDSSLDKAVAKELLQICNKYDHGYNDLTIHCNDLLNKKISLNVDDIEGALWSDDTSIDGESLNADINIYNNVYELMERQIIQDSPPSILTQKSFKMSSDEDSPESAVKENICPNNFEENLPEKVVINYDDIPGNTDDSLISKVVKTNKVIEIKLKEELIDVYESPKMRTSEMFKNLNQSDIKSSKSNIIPNTPFVQVESSRNYFNFSSAQVQECKNNDFKKSMNYHNVSLPQSPDDYVSGNQSPDLFAIEDSSFLEENFDKVSTPVLSNIKHLQKHLFKINKTSTEKCDNGDINDVSEKHKISSLVSTISSKIFEKHSNLCPVSEVSSNPCDKEYINSPNSPSSLPPHLETLNTKKLMNKSIILSNESNLSIINLDLEVNTDAKCLTSIKSPASTSQFLSDNVSQNSALLFNLVSPLPDIADNSDPTAMRSVSSFSDIAHNSDPTAMRSISPLSDVIYNSDTDDNSLNQFPLYERIASKSTALFKLKNIPSPVKSSNPVPSVSNFIIGQSEKCFKSVTSPDSSNSDSIILLHKSKLKNTKCRPSSLKLISSIPATENWENGASINTIEDKGVNTFGSNSDELSPTQMLYDADSSPSKNSSVTPLPHYSSMVTPILKKELGKFGIRKALPRKKAVNILKHIYEETHPWDTNSEVERNSAEPQNILAFKQKTNIKKKSYKIVKPKSLTQNKIKLCPSPTKMKATGIKIGNQEKTLPPLENVLNLSHTSSSGCESSQSDFPEESIILGEDCFSQQECSPNLTGKLFKLIYSNEELHFQILHYQPLELNALQKLIKSSGIKCSQAKLMDFLDEQCITFTLGKEHQRRHHKKRNSPRKINYVNRRKKTLN